MQTQETRSMKRPTLVCALVAAICGLVAVVPPAAHAQTSLIRSSSRMWRPTTGILADVTRSCEPLLVGRIDVRKELMMPGRQQAQADDLIEKQQQALITRRAEAFQQMRQTLRPG